ncbi:hypothetical protein J2Z66_001128 [Paenibacillus eucommiae]|uniref:Uncharacterized protein n=1 Tax=Paenibacillus eucommiae TaxID=1355755 RepID=A0ABS4IQV6_9BACL|nr:hypothetical protein [Paenibacillus eucommiae]
MVWVDEDGDGIIEDLFVRMTKTAIKLTGRLQIKEITLMQRITY